MITVHRLRHRLHITSKLSFMTAFVVQKKTMSFNYRCTDATFLLQEYCTSSCISIVTDTDYLLRKLHISYRFTESFEEYFLVFSPKCKHIFNKMFMCKHMQLVMAVVGGYTRWVLNLGNQHQYSSQYQIQVSLLVHPSFKLKGHCHINLGDENKKKLPPFEIFCLV